MAIPAPHLYSYEPVFLNVPVPVKVQLTELFKSCVAVFNSKIAPVEISTAVEAYKDLNTKKPALTDVVPV